MTQFKIGDIVEYKYKNKKKSIFVVQAIEKSHDNKRLLLNVYGNACLSYWAKHCKLIHRSDAVNVLYNNIINERIEHVNCSNSLYRLKRLGVIEFAIRKLFGMLDV